MQRRAMVISGLFWVVLSGCQDKKKPTWPAGAKLEVTKIKATKLTLTWPAAADEKGVTGYRVKRGDRVLAEIKPSVAATPYEVTGLTEASRYTFSVQARDGAGNWSTAIKAAGRTVDVSPPTWPKGSHLEVTKIVAQSADKPRKGIARRAYAHEVTFAWPEATDNTEVSVYLLKNTGKLAAHISRDKRKHTMFIPMGSPRKWELHARDVTGNLSAALTLGEESATRLTVATFPLPTNAGVLGLLKRSKASHIASIFGRDSALGKDSKDALGGLIGNQIGEPYGVGSLGLRGAGRGGGGTGGGSIGLGRLGTMGKTSGYGRGGGGFGRSRYKVTISGQGPQEVRTYLRRKKNRLHYCYEIRLRKVPTLQGKLSLDLAIDAAGRVTVTGVRGMTDPALQKCVKRAMLGRLSTAPGKAQTATYVFTFAPPKTAKKGAK